MPCVFQKTVAITFPVDETILAFFKARSSDEVIVLTVPWSLV